MSRAVTVLALLQCAALARAADPPPPSPPGWQLPAPSVQLEMDPDLIPIGKGAVFVPAMTDPGNEPPYMVRRQGEVVARTPAGKKTLLTPGRYTVLVGSGVESQMVAHSVEVFEGHCTLIAPNWAGLVVRVVDQHGMQIRGTYEIFSLPDGDNFGLGLGADEARSEKLRTWLLPAGRYLIVRAGESPRARTDFLTVRLLPGELVTFTLVQAQEDGAFMGGGVVDWGEGKTEFQRWRLGLIVGGDLLWNRNDNVTGREFGNSVSFNGFADWAMRYLDPNHLMYMRLQIEEGQTAQPGKGLQKTIDEVTLESVYTYRLLSWLGPYVRFGLDTNLFPGWKSLNWAEGAAGPATDVLVLRADDSFVRRYARPDELKLAESFDPLALKEGVGASFDLSPFQVLDLYLRVGFGARQYLVRSLLKAREHKAPETFPDCQLSTCYTQVEGSSLMGLEATLIGSARLSRFLMIDTVLDSLVPFWSTEAFKDPVINWKNTLSLRLASFVSLAYVIRLDFDRQLGEHIQAEQRILLRFTFDIL